MPKLIKPATKKRVPAKPPKSGDFVEYQQYKQPTATGIYAVRVPMQGTDVYCEDRFMYWDNDRQRWGYVGSTENYRGVVTGWIGPLQRLLQADDTPF